MDDAGRFIVAEAQNQIPANQADGPPVPDDYKPADLVLVDPRAAWVPTSLLGALAPDRNPLVYPTGLAWESPKVLLVCDVGLRAGWFRTDESERVMAQPPHLYRVDLRPLSQIPQQPPLIQRVTMQRQLVHPTKMTFDKKGRLLITDQGTSRGNEHNWRRRSNEFGLTIFFSSQRETTPFERNAFRHGIAEIINAEKPAHTSWWMTF